MKRPVLTLLACVALLPAGCAFGGGGDDSDTTTVSATGGAAGSGLLGFPAAATRNTTRVGGADATTDAAAVALATHPGTAPAAVVLADRRDWRSALAASVLAAAPLHAPVLLSAGPELPPVTQSAIAALDPSGSPDAGGAQIVRVGDVARPAKLKSVDVVGRGPEDTARAIDAFQANAAGKPSRGVIVVSSEHPELAMAAAGWSARTGLPILFATRDALPAATRTAISSHSRPRIFLLGSEDVIGRAVAKELGTLGTVTRVGGTDPSSTSVAAARLDEGEGAWNVNDPGHGLVFATADRPLDAVAAAPLSASGTYGPLVVLPKGGALPEDVRAFLLDIQPGYARNPTRGVYNHGWIVGDTAAVPVATQSAIDDLLEISPVRSQ